MSTIFRYSLARMRGQIIGWGLGLFGLGLLTVPLYESLASQAEQLIQLMESLPPQMMAFFGGADVSRIVTPEGFLDVRYFTLMPIILGIFAVLAGSSLLAGDEENGTLDLLLAHPISRTDLFVGRTLAFVAATLAIFFIAWLGLVVPTFWVAFDAAWGDIALPFMSLLAEVLLWSALALMVSMAFSSRRLGASITGSGLVASYFVTSLATVEGASVMLRAFANVSPFDYYQGGDAMLGLNGSWLFGLLGVALLFTLAAWWLFQRRDIRVAGEGGWRLNLPRQRARNAVT